MSGPGMAGLCAFAGIPGRDGRPKSVSVNIPSVGVTMTLAACRLFRSLSLPRLFFPTHAFPPLTLPSFPPPHHADDPPFSPRCRPSRRRRRSIHLLPRLRPSLPSIHHHHHPPHYRSPHQHQFVLFLQKNSAYIHLFLSIQLPRRPQPFPFRHLRPRPHFFPHPRQKRPRRRFTQARTRHHHHQLTTPPMLTACPCRQYPLLPQPKALVLVLCTQPLTNLSRDSDG